MAFVYRGIHFSCANQSYQINYHDKVSLCLNFAIGVENNVSFFALFANRDF